MFVRSVIKSSKKTPSLRSSCGLKSSTFNSPKKFSSQKLNVFKGTFQTNKTTFGFKNNKNTFAFHNNSKIQKTFNFNKNFSSQQKNFIKNITFKTYSIQKKTNQLPFKKIQYTPTTLSLKNSNFSLFIRPCAFFSDKEQAIENSAARRHDSELMEKLKDAQLQKEIALNRAKDAEKQIQRAKEALQEMSEESSKTVNVGASSEGYVTKEEFDSFKQEVISLLKKH